MIVIVDYGAGNLTSVQRAITHLGFDSEITDDPHRIINGQRVIFPGVGAAGSAMEGMQAKGIDHALKQSFDSGLPMLGICVGCQIILDGSEENHAACLGLIPGKAHMFPPGMTDGDGALLKVPHMGWNGLDIVQHHPLFNGIGPDDEFYFVHSYFPMPQSSSNIYGKTSYGLSFPSVIGTKNLFATQFHLEKSGEPGLKILRNFCTWEPKKNAE